LWLRIWRHRRFKQPEPQPSARNRKMLLRERAESQVQAHRDKTVRNLCLSLENLSFLSRNTTSGVEYDFSNFEWPCWTAPVMRRSFGGNGSGTIDRCLGPGQWHIPSRSGCAGCRARVIATTTGSRCCASRHDRHHIPYAGYGGSHRCSSGAADEVADE